MLPVMLGGSVDGQDYRSPVFKTGMVRELGLHYRAYVSTGCESERPSCFARGRLCVTGVNLRRKQAGSHVLKPRITMHTM